MVWLPWILFSYEYWVAIIIPIDEVIFFRGVAEPPTRYWSYLIMYPLLFLDNDDLRFYLFLIFLGGYTVLLVRKFASTFRWLFMTGHERRRLPLVVLRVAGLRCGEVLPSDIHSGSGARLDTELCASLGPKVWPILTHRLAPWQTYQTWIKHQKNHNHLIHTY